MKNVNQTQILYRKATTGKVMQWTMSMTTDDGSAYELCVSRGEVGGKVINDKGTVITKGLASRTILEQATLKYNSLVKKKRDIGYCEDPSGVSTTTLVLPMLAQNFDAHSRKINYPASAQPKLDGIRCMARVDPENDSGVQLFSRKGKVFTVLDDIADEIKKLNIGDVVLDGEVFSETLAFQRITGLVRKKTLVNQEDKDDMSNHVSLYVFDAYFPSNPELTFTERLVALEELLGGVGDKVKLVTTTTVSDSEEVDTLHDEYVVQRFEGVMIRNQDSVYEVDKRSYNLQKYKKFIDSEYIIVDASEGSGNDKGTVIWVCEKDAGGVRFNVRPTGTRDERKVAFQNQATYFGKLLTVKYQELTDGGIPRFPVGLSIRDYE
jgi:ATP-dependent DNA ligase